MSVSSSSSWSSCLRPFDRPKSCRGFLKLTEMTHWCHHPYRSSTITVAKFLFFYCCDCCRIVNELCVSCVNRSETDRAVRHISVHSAGISASTPNSLGRDMDTPCGALFTSFHSLSVWFLSGPFVVLHSACRVLMQCFHVEASWLTCSHVLWAYCSVLYGWMNSMWG